MEGVDHSKNIHVFFYQLDFLSHPASEFSQTVTQYGAFSLKHLCYNIKLIYLVRDAPWLDRSGI